MGYRGSKSVLTYTVKEQRVDGSYCKSMQLRCTLMGFEINYQFKIPSKQLNKRSISNLNLKTELSPWFITGFADAEGCFTIKIQPNVKLKTKWRIRPVFLLLYT